MGKYTINNKYFYKFRQVFISNITFFDIIKPETFRLRQFY